MFGPHLKLAAVSTIAALSMAHTLSKVSPGQAPKGEVQPSIASFGRAQAKAVGSSDSRARSGDGELRIGADPQGQYFTTVEINGSRFRMLVDTGATAVVLSYEDAITAGVRLFPSDYKYAASTANGVARVARVKLRRVCAGSLVVDDVDAIVGEAGALNSSLLGMTFLSRLSKIESSRGVLVLRQ
jgi:aspartyl protease family protein